jgi:hypothetical protein
MRARLRDIFTTSDSGLFRTREQLETEGWTLAGNIFSRSSERYLPLYEGRLGHQIQSSLRYTARWGLGRNPCE